MSSLYNMVHGVNPAAGSLLQLLNLSPEDFGRFRDAWLTDTDDHLRIVVHTRCGGGNREAYEEVFDSLEKHPNYLRDYDCEYDSTYADIEFSIPEEHRQAVDELLSEAEKMGAKERIVDSRTQEEHWTQAMEAIKTAKLPPRR